jgi:hypothetical protein
MVVSLLLLRAIRLPRFRKAASSAMSETPEAVERRLLEMYQEAHQVYAFKVAELEQASSRTFADLLEQVEGASAAVETARAALDAFRPVRCRNGRGPFVQ